MGTGGSVSQSSPGSPGSPGSPVSQSRGREDVFSSLPLSWERRSERRVGLEREREGGVSVAE